MGVKDLPIAHICNITILKMTQINIELVSFNIFNIHAQEACPALVI